MQTVRQTFVALLVVLAVWLVARSLEQDAPERSVEPVPTAAAPDAGRDGAPREAAPVERVAPQRRVLVTDEHTTEVAAAEPHQVVAAGSVVDSLGRSVAGAVVTLAPATDDGARPATGRTTRADGEGRFEFTGADDAGPTADTSRVVLVADGPDGLDSASQTVDVGSLDVVLVVDAAGAVEGRVLLDGSVAPGEVRVNRTQVAPDDRRSTLHTYAIPDADGFFRLERLRPGTIRIEIVPATGIADEVLATVEPVDVRPGVTTQLAAIDLRGVVRVHEVRVEDAAGAPIAHGRGLQFAPDMASGVSNDLEVVDGLTRIVTAQPRCDVWIGATGHRTVALYGVDGPRVVVLEPALTVRVRLLNAAELPPDLRISTRLRSGASAWSWMLGELLSSPFATFDAGGEATLLAPSEGTFPLTFRLEFAPESRRSPVPYDHRPPLEVEVVASGVELVVDVALDPELVRAAAARR